MKKSAKNMKMKMNKMYAAVYTCIDHEDPEDSIVEVIGVYSSKKTAEAMLEKHKQDFLDSTPWADEEDPEYCLLNDDTDHTYSWHVDPVKVEA